MRGEAASTAHGSFDVDCPGVRDVSERTIRPIAAAPTRLHAVHDLDVVKGGVKFRTLRMVLGEPTDVGVKLRPSDRPRSGIAPRVYNLPRLIAIDVVELRKITEFHRPGPNAASCRGREPFPHGAGVIVSRKPNQSEFATLPKSICAHCGPPFFNKVHPGNIRLSTGCHLGLRRSGGPPTDVGGAVASASVCRKGRDHPVCGVVPVG